MKRAFLLKSSTAHTAPDFDLRQVASTSGRIDIVCRCLLAAFTGPKGLRHDVEFTAILEGPPHPPITLTAESRKLSKLPADEEEAASWIYQALQPTHHAEHGLQATRKNFEKALKELLSQPLNVYYLHEQGKDIEETETEGREGVGFILGDQMGLDAQSERLLDSLRIPRVSLGPRSYLSSNCITFVNAQLDFKE